MFQTKKTQHKQKAKEINKIGKQEETKEEKEKGNVVTVTNICGKSNEIRWYGLRICSLYLRDQPTKRERVLINNKLWKTFVYICLLYVQDENQDMLMR